MTTPTIVLNGTFRDAAGDPQSGTLSFRLNHDLVDSVGNVVSTRESIVSTLDSQGRITDTNGTTVGLTLYCTSGGDIAPAGLLYDVRVDVGDRPKARVSVALPSTLGASVDWADLVPVPSSTGVVWTVPDLTAEQARDLVGTTLVAGAGIAIAVDDPGDTVTVTAEVTQAELDQEASTRAAAIAALSGTYSQVVGGALSVGGVALTEAPFPASLARRIRGYTSASPFLALTNNSATFTTSVRGIDATDSRVFAVDTTNDGFKQSTDWGVTWSTNKTVPTNVTVNSGSNLGQIVRFGNYLWLVAKDNTDSRWKVWRASPAAGNTAFSWGSPLLTLAANATANQPVMNTDGVNLIIAEYGDPTGGPSAYRISLADANGAGTNWVTVYGPDATLRHIHCVAPDPYNAGHWWMTTGDGIAKTIQRSTDNGSTWSVIVVSSVWQGVQISFDPTYIYIAGDSQRGTVIALDRATFTPRIAAKNVHSLLPVPSFTASKTWDAPSVADGAMTSTTVTLTGVNTGNGPFVLASLSTSVPAGCQLTAQVTAADTVTVTLVNHSGGAVDLASATLRVSTAGGSFYNNAYFGAVDPATGIYYCVANDTSVAGTTPGWFILPRVGDSLAVFGAFPNMQPGVAYFGGGFVFMGNYRHALLTLD